MLTADAAAGQVRTATGRYEQHSPSSKVPQPRVSAMLDTRIAAHELEQGTEKVGAPSDRVEKRDSAESIRQQVEEAVAKTNNGLQMNKRNIRFRIHDESNDVQIQVVDTDKDEVIRTIPSDEMIRLAMRTREFAHTGIMVDASS